MKKKIILISVIIAILIAGIVIAGIISKSRVRATTDLTCTCGSSETSSVEYAPCDDGIHCILRLECKDCGEIYYGDKKTHSYTAYVNAYSDGHYVNCVWCSKELSSLPQEHELGTPVTATMERHLSECVCGYSQYDNCVYDQNYIKIDDLWHNVSCVCGATSKLGHVYNDNGVCPCGVTSSSSGGNSGDSGDSSCTDHDLELEGIEPNTENTHYEYYRCSNSCTYTETKTVSCSWTVGEGNPVYHNLECECGNVSKGSHNWSSGVCVDTSTDKGCNYVCGHEEITVTEIITVATCASAGTVYEECDYCDLGGVADTQVDPDNHTNWIPATCFTPETCEGCGETRGTTEEHSFEYYEDNEDDETHTKYCTNSGCGYSEPEDHYNDDGDNLCDACDYVMSSGTTHTHTGGTHANGGKCTVEGCGVTYQTHTQSATIKEYKKTATEHTPVYGCTYSGCTGTFDGETQTHYISGGEGTDNNDGTHTGNCKVCSEPYTEVHRDEDNNNECDICEATLGGGTTHTHTGGTHENGGKCTVEGCEVVYQNHSKSTTVKEYKKTETKHTPVYGCTYSECTGTYEGTAEAHKDEDSNNKCDLCDYTMSSGGTIPECEHTNTTWGRTAKEHWKVCIDCGEEVTGTRKAHSYTNGKCECGRLEDSTTCEHKNKEWKSNKDEHWQVCKDCGEEIEGTRDNHTYDEDKCKDCGTDKDSTTSGKDIPDTGSKPVVIGIVSIIAIMGMSIIGIKRYKGI